MPISRRDLFRIAGGGASALGGLVASGVSLAPVTIRAQELRIAKAKVTPSVCPFCSVGCATLVHTVDGRIVNIEGDPGSPISEGHLCPKGAASYQLLHHPGRLTRIKYRAPRSKEWTEIPLERAMDMVADRVWATRERTFVEEKDGQMLMQCEGIGHLGGATLDNEEITRVSNQARI
jgi:formate dehydrogenase major subunit